MSLDKKVDGIAKDVKRIIILLMGNLDNPDENGLVTKVKRNTDFRLVYQDTIKAVKTRFWFILIAIVFAFMLGTFGKGLIQILGGK